MFSKLLIFLLGVAAVAACATQQPQTPQERQQEEIKRQEQPVVQIPANARLAEAVLDAKNGSNVHGTVTFEQLPNNMIVFYKIEGLPPNQEFGFHVHENGDCNSDDGKSAGGHFFPLSETGGTSKDFPGHYAGDMQMIHSDDAGLAENNYKTNKLTVAKARAVIGRSVIIHEGPDDPTKPSSKRIACGVINYKQPTVSNEEGENHD